MAPAVDEDEHLVDVVVGLLADLATRGRLITTTWLWTPVATTSRKYGFASALPTMSRLNATAGLLSSRPCHRRPIVPRATGPAMLPAMPDRDAQPTADRIADRYWDALLALRPTLATYVGDDRFDDRLDDPGLAGRAAVRSLHERTLAELDGLAPGEAGAVTADILRFVCEADLAVDASGWPLLESVNQVEGPQLVLAFMAQVQAVDTPDRVDRWLARLAAYPAFIDAHVERIREARGRGILPARLIAERVVDGLERSLIAPAESSPLVTVPGLADPLDRGRIADAVRRSVRPADERLLEAIREILPETRGQPGLAAVPGGDAMYAARLHLWTTIRTDPDDLHRFGLADLDRLDEERRAITRAAGFGEDIAAYRRSLGADPSDLPGSADELLGRMREDLAGRSRRPRAGSADCRSHPARYDRSTPHWRPTRSAITCPPLPDRVRST